MVLNRQGQQGNLPVVPLVYEGGTTWAATGPEGFGDSNNTGAHILTADGAESTAAPTTSTAARSGATTATAGRRWTSAR